MFKNPFIGKVSKELKEVKILKKDYKSLYKRYKKGAEKRNLEFKLSEEFFLHTVTSHCSFCGCPPFQVHNKIKYMGIDRTSNERGYTESNSSPCCKRCNFAKGSMKFWEFDEWLETIVEYYPKMVKSIQNNSFDNIKKKSGYKKALEIMNGGL